MFCDCPDLRTVAFGTTEFHRHLDSRKLLQELVSLSPLFPSAGTDRFWLDPLRRRFRLRSSRHLYGR